MNTDLRKTLRIVETKNRRSGDFRPSISLTNRTVRVDDSLRMEVQVTGEMILRVDTLIHRAEALSLPEAAVSEEIKNRLSHAAYEHLYGDLNRRFHEIYNNLSYLPFSPETGTLMGQIRELQYIYRNKF